VPGYVANRLVGRGASGEVWSARVAGSIDEVALKVIAVPTRRALLRAEREAAALIALDHPHLVRLHEVVPLRDAMVLVLDLADAGALSDVLASRGRLSAGEVVAALAPVAAAVDYAHLAGVVHGDICASNIVFAAAGYPLLADLGVARLRGESHPAHATAAYVDPSVVLGSAPAPASDVFSLGAVAFHALTGQTVWPDTSTEDALAAALRGDLDRLEPALVAAATPAGMRAVVLRALHREPRLRGTAADFALDLRHAAEPVPVELAAGRTSPVPPTGRSGRRAPRHTGRHAAPPRHAASRDETATPPPAEPVDEATVDAPGNAALGSTAPQGLYTAAVVARARPAVPRGRARRLGRRIPPWLRVATALALVAVGTAVAVWSVLGSTRHPTHPAGAEATLPLDVPTLVPTLGPSAAGPDQSPSSSGPPPAPLDAADASTILTQLDALREHAFATRTSLLLTGVYLDGPLLTADEQELNRLVPTGCGLEGARTSYTHVRVVGQDGTTVQLSADAQLAPSVLICNGNASGQAAGTKPEQVSILLMRRGSGWAIAGLTR
jgi:serine/threonine protein kinase